MKKFATLIAALILCFALCISASAYTASEALNTSNAPTGTTEATYGNRTVTAEVYPAGTTFSTGKYLSGKDFCEFSVYGPNNNYVTYCYPGSSFTLPNDGQVYYFSMMDGYSFSTEDVYVTSGAAAEPAPQYGNYVVEAGYSMTYFYKAYAERAIPVNKGNDSENYLIPLNIQSGSKFGFGGMEGYCFPTAFFKANYDATAGTLTDLTQIPLDYQMDEWGYAPEMCIDDVVRAAEGIYGNAIVFTGSSNRMDELNSDIYYATFLVQVDGQKPGAPVPAPVESFTDVTEENTFYTAIDYVTKKGLMDGASDTAFNSASAATQSDIYASLELVGTKAAEAKTWAAEQNLDESSTIAREDAITMLWIANGKQDADVSVLDKFADAGAISAECKTAMAWAVETGLLQGYANGHLGAQVQLTRGAMAAVLYRHLT